MRLAGSDPKAATPLDPDELAGLIPKHVTNRAQLNELEQANIQAGLLWLSGRRPSNPLTETFLRQLHRKLFGEVWRWAGEFRQSEKNIGVDPINIAAELRVLQGDAAYWSEHGTYSPLEAGARFHHRLVKIHLFPNGNGRHGRIAADLYIEKEFDHLPIDWTAGFDLQHDNRRRSAYIAALREADNENYEPLLVFVGAR